MVQLKFLNFHFSCNRLLALSFLYIIGLRTNSFCYPTIPSTNTITMKKVLIGLLILVAIIVIAGFIAPGKIEVIHTSTINAPASKIFDEINDLERWGNWSYWNQLYKGDMKVVYGDIKTGVGGNYSWDGKDSGKGKITITESIPPQSIKVDLDFMEQGTAKSWYTFKEENGTTTFTQGFQSDMGINPLMHLVGVFLLKPEMNKAFAHNAEQLKKIAESKP